MNLPCVNRFFYLRSLTSRYTIFKSTTPNQHVYLKALVEMPPKKKQRKTKFLKRDSLCMIAELEKGSYSDRCLPDVYGENTSGNSSTTV